MRYLLVALSLAMGSVTSADAQVSVGIGVDIGINVATYPRLVLVPGYPVYYDPRASSNFFFYDGLYWVFQGDDWYASSWYNGPWQPVAREQVPVYVLRVPVRYYRQPPVYFRGWRADAPPRWGEHWGRGWEDSVAAGGIGGTAAPLRVRRRCRSTSGGTRAIAILARRSSSTPFAPSNYRYQPREPVAREHFQPRGYSDGPRAPSRSGTRQVRSGRTTGAGCTGRNGETMAGRTGTRNAVATRVARAPSRSGTSQVRSGRTTGAGCTDRNGETMAGRTGTRSAVVTRVARAPSRSSKRLVRSGRMRGAGCTDRNRETMAGRTGTESAVTVGASRSDRPRGTLGTLAAEERAGSDLAPGHPGLPDHAACFASSAAWMDYHLNLNPHLVADEDAARLRTPFQTSPNSLRSTLARACAPRRIAPHGSVTAGPRPWT